MKLNKLILIATLILISTTNIFANEKYININFKNLQIIDLIKVTSKIINKNILLTQKISGKVDFVSNKPVAKEDVLNILIYVLESKGFTIVDNNGILRVVRINDAAKYNMPVTNGKSLKTYQMVTEVFVVENANVDYISSKIRHLISKSAKLVTDKESNSLMLTDFVTNIKTIKKVIGLISKDNKKFIKSIKLKNIKASEILADLKAVAKAIYNEKIEIEKVSILVNKDTNSIMFVGKKENVNYLLKYVENIDKQGSLVAKSVEVIYLKNAESKNVIKIIRGIIANKKYKDANNKPYASNDEESNSIILMGKKSELIYFKDLVSKLDIDRQQVYVQAKIIEISQTKLEEVGIKYGLSGFTRGSGGLATMSSSLNGGTAPDLTSLASFGFELDSLKNALSLGMTLNLLNQNAAVDIVSEPSLLCINNKASSIYVGKTISIKTGTTTTTGGVPTDTYKREDIGLTLKVKPRISKGGKVLLEISTTLENAERTATNGNPNTSKKELETTAIVNNGESVILGGYIREEKGTSVDKIPFLGDIPLIGSLFRSTNDMKDKINLVIIITPYIIPKSKDLTFVRNQLAQLKLLEDKYTKDTIIRLSKAKLEAKKEKLQRDADKSKLDEEHLEVDNKINYLKLSPNKQNNQKEYIDKIFGL
ncbi:MAG TPA: type II secretion system protein GspD [Arcobacter sp.]|nr:type II secretion system protein GspD [Arcobacter sp.]